MSEDSHHEILIGERTYPIRRFKGLKAALAGALMSRVMRELPQLQERAQAFRRDFREKNTIIITPAMAKLPRFAPLGLTDSDFRAAGGKIEFPEEPDGGALLVNIFPDLFELASKELQKFFAILVISNSELEEADDADRIDEELTKIGKRLMREGDLDELLELVVVGLDVLKEQMASKRDRLGKLPIPLLQYLMADQEKDQVEEPVESDGPGQMLPTPSETSPSPSPSSVLPSSTDSPSDSDGIDEPLFTESPGTS